jgi:hypothetical protein
VASGEEVEVVDLTHPLFGRRFALVSVTGALVSAGYARVQYRPGIVLMLRLPVTSLWPHPERRTLRTKLSIEALAELVGIAGESEGNVRRAQRRVAQLVGGPATAGRVGSRRRAAGGEP